MTEQSYEYPSADAKEEAWAQVDILELTDPAQAATWDSTLHGLENNYVSAEIWQEALDALRAINRP